MRLAVEPTDAGIETWLNEGLNLEIHQDARQFRLDRLLAVMPFLPIPPAPCTITGTKGKGSTARLIECALCAAGQPTVAFTSPHLQRITERWRIDGVDASPAIIANRALQVIAAEARAGEHLTYFERSFAIAVILACERPSTRFVLEVGLGGRLDCANVLHAAVVVITHLSRDHCQLLGPTEVEIAREKLALCRSGRPLVVAPQSLAGAKAIATTPLPLDVPVTRVTRMQPAFALALLGDHQQDNASTAWAALRHFAPEIDECTARRGFAQATLAGRCQLVEHGGRRILVDGAHNAASVAATLTVAQRSLRPGWQLMMGLARDKIAEDILPLIPSDLTVRRVGYTSPRARDEATWPAPARQWPWSAHIADALAAMPTEVDLCITGSFYLAGEALHALAPAATRME